MFGRDILTTPRVPFGACDDVSHEYERFVSLPPAVDNQGLTLGVGTVTKACQELRVAGAQQITTSPALGRKAGLVALGGESVLRYRFDQASAFHEGPWLVALSTMPPTDVL